LAVQESHIHALLAAFPTVFHQKDKKISLSFDFYLRQGGMNDFSSSFLSESLGFFYFSSKRNPFSNPPLFWLL